MIRTIEAVITENGEVRVAESVKLRELHRALVMILEEPPTEALDTALLSEKSLEDWSRPEEDEAWAHLQ